jgi:hypothetical protein
MPVGGKIPVVKKPPTALQPSRSRSPLVSRPTSANNSQQNVAAGAAPLGFGGNELMAKLKARQEKMEQGGSGSSGVSQQTSWVKPAATVAGSKPAAGKTWNKPAASTDSKPAAAGPAPATSDRTWTRPAPAARPVPAAPVSGKMWTGPSAAASSATTTSPPTRRPLKLPSAPTASADSKSDIAAPMSFARGAAAANGIKARKAALERQATSGVDTSDYDRLGNSNQAAALKRYSDQAKAPGKPGRPAPAAAASTHADRNYQYYDALVQLKQMFPNYSDKTLKQVLNNRGGDLQKSIDRLLQ